MDLLGPPDTLNWSLGAPRDLTTTMRAVAPTLAATAPRARLPTRPRAPNRGATRPRATPPGGATPQMESSSSSEGAAKVAGDEETDASSPPSSSVASTAHGTPRWREFTLAFTGNWRGRCVEFDDDGCARDIPIRYVHGVGRVPRANMPFADTDNDWVTRCDCVSTEDGVKLQAQRAMPEIGNEDAISSCGAAEWNDGAELLVADEEVRILRGSGEDKTVLPDGSFSAGARRLPTDDDDDGITAVHQCVADPSDPNRRIRIVQRVRLDSSASENHHYSMQSCDVWLETRTKQCPRGFSADPRPDVTNPNGRAWVGTLGGANFVLDWPKEENPGPELKDGGSLFRAATDEYSESASQSQSSSIAVAGSEKANACGQLLRLPGGAWAYCGAHPDDASIYVVECGYTPGGNSIERTVASRAYDVKTGRLVRVVLGRDVLVDARRD